MDFDKMFLVLWRCIKIFTSYFPLSTPQIIEQIGDDSVISLADVEKYLNDSLIPFVTQQYGKSFKVNATLGQFVKDLVNAMENGKIEEWGKFSIFSWSNNLQQL